MPTGGKVAAWLVAASVVGGCASGSDGVLGQPTTSTAAGGHGGLTDHDFSVAVGIARAEADKAATAITSATATAGAGMVTDPNAGPPCTSGRLLHITLIGTFNIVSDSAEPVSAVSITADPKSAKACLISVRTGQATPDPGAAVLFTHWTPPAGRPSAIAT